MKPSTEPSCRTPNKVPQNSGEPLGARTCLLKTVFSFPQKPRKGGVSKGGFCRVECQQQKYPRILAQQYIKHSERHSQERRIFCKKPVQTKTFPWFLTPTRPRLSKGSKKKVVRGRGAWKEFTGDTYTCKLGSLPQGSSGLWGPRSRVGLVSKSSLGPLGPGGGGGGSP